MILSNDINQELEEFVDNYLEDYSFEELLEEFDLTPHEVFTHLFYTGLIDEDRLKAYLLDG